MKFLAIVEVIGTGQQWKVVIDKDVPDPLEYVESVIDHFNYNKRPGQKAREVVDVIILTKSIRTKFPKVKK